MSGLKGASCGLRRQGCTQRTHNGAAPVERLFLRRSLPARSTRNSLPTFTLLWASCGRPCWAALPPLLTAPAPPPPTGRFAMVSMTMAWLRLECAFRLVKANTLHEQGRLSAGTSFRYARAVKQRCKGGVCCLDAMRGSCQVGKLLQSQHVS